MKVFKNVHAADEGDFWGHFPVRQPYKLHIIESSPTTTDISSRLSSFFFSQLGGKLSSGCSLQGSEIHLRAESQVGGRLSVLQECRRKRDPSFIGRRSTRRYGKSRSSTKACLRWALVPTDPSGKPPFV